MFTLQLTLQHERHSMLASADEVQLLQNIVRAIGSRKTLDIGIYQRWHKNLVYKYKYI